MELSDVAGVRSVDSVGNVIGENLADFLVRAYEWDFHARAFV